MTALLAFLLLLYALRSVGAVPMRSLDPMTFFQNGLDAQRQNAEFAALNVTNHCQPKERACITGSLAHCVCGAWVVAPCPASEQCFALPSIKENGTVLTCTTEATAMSIMNATGVQGGLTSDSSGNGSTSAEGDCSSTLPSSLTSVLPTAPSAFSSTPVSDVSSVSPTAASSVLESSTDSVIIVTVTVTATPVSIMTLPVETLTLNPAEVSSLLASITAGDSYSVLSLGLSPFPSNPVSTIASMPKPSCLSNGDLVSKVGASFP
ncbi:hypothetical protein AcW1_001847 [Taiwanofungus camphoratus]|nr:hypothetical protein AcV5_000103 [Antrodia cinnamomea]KAI0945066.1 hypothetical protein AcV7_001699 [Antrodia cinnamomea]KAI0945683.1 hypothetical protein AcW1_001847 [Antrodia cinnamomea]